jgi:hypothetical protein
MPTSSKKPRSAIVIAIDRLGAGFLGPYGNTWVDTPALNRVAASGILCENVVADSPDLNLLYRSMWTGRHAMDRREVSTEASLATMLSTEFQTALVTDAQEVLGHPLTAAFQQHVSLDQPALDRPAASIEETGIGQVCMAAVEELEKLTPGTLLWVHARGMDGAWDAPLELRERFRDEEDPPPYPLVQPPRWELATDHDPDELLSVMHAFAGQVSLVDAWIGILLDALVEHPQRDNTLFMITSPRGYPLGEHRWVGPGGELYGEELRTPLLIRHPNHAVAASRLQTLIQPADIFATLADWFGLETTDPRSEASSLLQLADDERVWNRECAFSLGETGRAVTTPAWFFRVDQTDHGELFAKPDDRWEVNEVADRCGDIPQQLARLIEQYDEFLNSNRPGNLPELSRELIEGID